MQKNLCRLVKLTPRILNKMHCEIIITTSRNFNCIKLIHSTCSQTKMQSCRVSHEVMLNCELLSTQLLKSDNNTYESMLKVPVYFKFRAAMEVTFRQKFSCTNTSHVTSQKWSDSLFRYFKLPLYAVFFFFFK